MLLSVLIDVVSVSRVKVSFQLQTVSTTCHEMGLLSPVVHPRIELVCSGCRVGCSNVGRLLHVEGGGVGPGVARHAGHVAGRSTGVARGEAPTVRSVDLIGFSFASARGEEISELSFITSAIKLLR